MAYYNLDGNIITQEEWVQLYEPFYYLDGPVHGHAINHRNQGSHFAEEQIEHILENGFLP